MKTNLEIVQEAYFNFSQGNIPAMLDAMSEGIEWELPSSAHVNFAGKFSGKQGVLDFFNHVNSENEFNEFAVDTFVASGNHVVAIGHLSAKAKSTGKTSSNKWAHFWELKDGKIVKHYEYADTAEIRDAFSN